VRKGAIKLVKVSVCE